MLFGRGDDSPNRRVGGTRSIGVALWDWMPAEDEAPVEAAHLNAARRGVIVGQRFRTDHVNHRHHHVPVILRYPVQQWL